MLHAVSGRLCRSFSGVRHNESNSIDDDDGYEVTTTSANFPTRGSRVELSQTRGRQVIGTGHLKCNGLSNKYLNFD